MASADRATIALITDYFSAMEAKDYDRLGTFYTDDVRLTFANDPAVSGRDAVLARMIAIGDRVDSLSHPLVEAWQEEGGRVIIEVDSVWRFPDGAVHTIRACSIFTVDHGRFREMRIYVDNSPIATYLEPPS